MRSSSRNVVNPAASELPWLADGVLLRSANLRSSALFQRTLPMQDTTKLAYGVLEAAEALGVGKSTVWRLIEAGELATFRLGARRLIRRDVLEAFVDSRSCGTGS